MTVTGVNQPPPLEGYNLFRSDRAVVETLQREGAGWADEQVGKVGELIGGEPLVWGYQANAHPPVLRSHDRFGERIDEVEFHPAWHAMMRFSIGHGVHALPWRDRRPGAHVTRAALLYLVCHVEAGHACPVSMTFAATPLLEAAADGPEWVPRFTSLAYDERAIPASRKTGALCGMAMTERQGGSDVRTNTTRARWLSGSGPGAEYAVTGQKWFCSAPMCDAFVVLAQTDRGLSCFLLPRWKPDGTRNGFRIERLKDKLGNRSNASAEVTFDGAWARLVGEDGRGIVTIMEMSDTLASNALSRRPPSCARQWRRRRTTRRIAQPSDDCSRIMRSCRTSWRISQSNRRRRRPRRCVWPEPTTSGRVTRPRAASRGSRRPSSSTGSVSGRRLSSPKRSNASAATATSRSVSSRVCIARRPPTPSGKARATSSASTSCARSRVSARAWMRYSRARAGQGSRSATRHLRRLCSGRARPAGGHRGWRRRIVERLALALEASLLLRGGHPAVADAFVASRLTPDHGLAFGTLPRGGDFKAILERARPAV
jgi:putative acyl-CoA dehydrogenase